MKKSSIFIIAIVGIMISILLVNLGNASEYSTFTQAKTQFDQGTSREIHVIGTLQKDAQGHVVGILPSESQLEFSFKLIDNDGKQETIYYPKPMPADFMSSEQVVVVGSYRQENDETYFLANQILLKCPSKYEETELQASAVQ